MPLLTHYRTAREPHTLWRGFPVLPWESYQAHQRRACKGHISKGREAEHKGVVPKERAFSCLTVACSHSCLWRALGSYRSGEEGVKNHCH